MLHSRNYRCRGIEVSVTHSECVLVALVIQYAKLMRHIVLASVVCPAVQYRLIRKSRRDFRPLRYSSRDGYAEGEHVNRGRDTPSFCPTLQVLDMSMLGDAAAVNPVIKFLPHTCDVCGRNLIEICRVTKGGYIEHL